MQKELILASSSPRRQALLKQVGLHFSVRVGDVDESEVVTNDPVDKVKQLAKFKGECVPFSHEDEVILSADTIVAHNDTIFGKPHDELGARHMIEALSGTTHEVYTGVAIRSVQETLVFVEKTIVEFWPLEEVEIMRYVQTKEPYDKAGAYGIQSIGARFVKRIIGDYYNVVGLPVSRVVRELKRFGIGK